MINEKQLEEKIAASPAARVTKEQIESRIVDHSSHVPPTTPTVTIVTIKLDNGYSVRGESACVNPENFDAEIGYKIAYDNAFKQLWALFGFMLAEDQFRNKLEMQEAGKQSAA